VTNGLRREAVPLAQDGFTAGGQVGYNYRREDRRRRDPARQVGGRGGADRQGDGGAGGEQRLEQPKRNPPYLARKHGTVACQP
jgi:hypothetical protein